MKELTRVQAQVLESLRKHAERGDPTPTYRELCRQFGWKSTGTIRDHLRALANKGFVTLTKRHRNIRLCEDRPAAVFVPVLGRVVAGIPVLSEQTVERHVPIPSEWISGQKLFALKVAGDSMRDAGILEGDHVILRQAVNPNNGDIVVATIEGETTVKRFRFRNRRPTLFAENPAYKPIELGRNSIVQGIVVGLFRSYRDRADSSRIKSDL
jgi:repressor LexA